MKAQVYSKASWELFDALDVSRDPRGPDYLHEIAGQFLAPGSRILDAGCRDASHLIRLLRSSPGSTGVGVDPVAWHIERATALVASEGMASRVELVRGTIEDAAVGPFDVIWCRDVLEVVDDDFVVAEAMKRLLAPGGRLLVYTVFATERLEPREAAMLHAGLGNNPAAFDRSHVEAAFVAAGLQIEWQEHIGTEWREYDEERTKPASQALLRLARLRRDREHVIQRFGQAAYETAEASLHWLPYLLLGKLEPAIYLLRP